MLRLGSLLLIAALTTLLLTPPPAFADQPPTAFVDTAGTSHEAAVAALVEEQVVEGCSADSFCADRSLTRGQLATMLARALDLEPDPVLLASGPFTDTIGTTHERAITALSAAGIVAGCEEERFCPNAPITREQLATMLDRALGFPDVPDAGRYFIDIRGTHEAAIERLAAQGVTNGCGPVEFCPTSEVSRAHAAVFFARALELVERVHLTDFDQRLALHEEQERARERERERLREERRERERQQAIHDRGQRALEVALDQLGKPYAWGGSGPHRFDCSGLTSFAWRAAGVEIPRTSRQQHAAITRVSRSELIPGDLVFYHSPVSHVAIYLGDGKVVEAPNSRGVVRIRTDGLTRSGVVGYGRPGV